MQQGDSDCGGTVEVAVTAEVCVLILQTARGTTL